MERIEIIDTNVDNILKYGVCGYKNIKRAGYPEKLEWLKDRFSEGMKIKTLYSDKDGTQGMIEYIPGEYCWRPVEASGYMFIHCIFVGFKNVKEISETAEKTYGIKPNIIDLKNCEEAQNSPCAFGAFCMIYNGKVIAHHPISKGRFTNIMKKELNKKMRLTI